MHSTSKILLSREAYKKNLRFFKRQFGPNVRFSSVIKGNAYGHGIEEFGRMAVECGVDHFSVFSADEAWRLWNALEVCPETMIMGYIDDQAMEWAVQHHIQFWVFDLNRLQRAIDTAKKLVIPAKIHLELETGMHRTGLEQKEWSKAIQLIKKNTDHLVVKGICTHFAGAESISNFVRIKEQKKVFRSGLAYFKKRGIEPEVRHACCSAAAIRYPEMHYDLVRIGIMQYGFWSSREIFIEFLKDRSSKVSPIKRLITWKSRVMSIKEVQTGEFIGYGNHFFTESPTRVAIIPIGYSNGFKRSLSNTGRAIIRGRRVAVIGLVNMNCLAVDITELKEVLPGDEVILIGRQGKQEITVSSFTEMSQQLNYETLTRIPESIERVVE